MKSVWQWDADLLAEHDLFSVQPVTRKCPYCGNTYRPAWTKPTPDQTFGRWQQYCSRVCRKLWNEEHKEG